MDQPRVKPLAKSSSVGKTTFKMQNHKLLFGHYLNKKKQIENTKVHNPLKSSVTTRLLLSEKQNTEFQLTDRSNSCFPQVRQPHFHSIEDGRHKLMTLTKTDDSELRVNYFSEVKNIWEARIRQVYLMLLA